VFASLTDEVLIPKSCVNILTKSHEASSEHTV